MVNRREQAVGGSESFLEDGFDSIVVAAHELKTPLAVMRQLSLELERSPEGSDAQQLARQIRLTAERSLRLTRDLTQASRFQSELFPLEPLNSRLVLNSVVQEMAPLYNAHGRKLVLRMPRKLPNIVSHSDLLRRILLNFADNALHYADEKDTVIIEGIAMRGLDKVRLGVLDGGPHIAAKRVQRARLHTDYGRPESSGLGLMVADSFARAIGGTTGLMHKKSGSFYYIDVPISTQLSLV